MGGYWFDFVGGFGVCVCVCGFGFLVCLFCVGLLGCLVDFGLGLFWGFVVDNFCWVWGFGELWVVGGDLYFGYGVWGGGFVFWGFVF